MDFKEVIGERETIRLSIDKNFAIVSYCGECPSFYNPVQHGKIYTLNEMLEVIATPNWLGDLDPNLIHTK